MPQEAWDDAQNELQGDPVSPTDPNDPIGCAPDIPVAALDPLEPPGLSPTPQRVYDEVILQSGCCECTTGQDCRDDNLCTSQHICHCTCEYRYHCPTTSSPCGSQTCDPNIGCVTVPVNCNDDNPCTHDSCDPGFGCVHTPVCPDPSDACTTRWCDAPAGGVCRADPVDCDDDNPCTTDWCELPAGCRNECAGVCCDGVCCAAGQTCCGGTTCCTPEHCCNSQCCAEPCEGCILHGSISGGSITADPNPPCFGEMLFFTLNGAADSGGLKWEDCSSVPVQPVPLTITWHITKPSGTVVSGSGDVAVVEVDEIGTYTCVFMASAVRECAPEEIALGPETVQMPSNYSTVEIQYKTFIACRAISSGSNPFLYDFYSGDGRSFAYGQADSSRTAQSGQVTVYPANASGQVGTPSATFGTTTGFNDDPAGSDIGVGPVWPCGPCIYFPLETATSDCTESAVNGVGGNLLAMEYTRLTESMVHVHIDVIALNPCVSMIDPPVIDAQLNIRFRQNCSGGVLSPMEFMLYGNHDGYPWHELYVNGVLIYSHNPCVSGEGPDALLPPPERSYEYASFNGTPLDLWQPVPGFDP